MDEALCEIWDMNEEDEEEVDEERYVPAYGEKEKRWREQKGDFSSASSKYECYEINERSLFTGCCVFDALTLGRQRNTVCIKHVMEKRALLCDHGYVQNLIRSRATLLVAVASHTALAPNCTCLRRRL
jgi:hypothetical protein